jgi:hypothetical protein
MKRVGNALDLPLSFFQCKERPVSPYLGVRRGARIKIVAKRRLHREADKDLKEHSAIKREIPCHGSANPGEPARRVTSHTPRSVAHFDSAPSVPAAAALAACGGVHTL